MAEKPYIQNLFRAEPAYELERIRAIKTVIVQVEDEFGETIIVLENTPIKQRRLGRVAWNSTKSTSNR